MQAERFLQLGSLLSPAQAFDAGLVDAVLDDEKALMTHAFTTLERYQVTILSILYSLYVDSLFSTLYSLLLLSTTLYFLLSTVYSLLSTLYLSTLYSLLSTNLYFLLISTFYQSLLSTNLSILSLISTL